MQPFMPPIMPQPFHVQSPGPQAFVTWQPQPLLPQIGPCSNCNQLGHFAKNCLLPPRQKGFQGPRRQGPYSL